jgi:hypothetical protein
MCVAVIELLDSDSDDGATPEPRANTGSSRNEPFELEESDSAEEDVVRAKKKNATVQHSRLATATAKMAYLRVANSPKKKFPTAVQSPSPQLSSATVKMAPARSTAATGTTANVTVEIDSSDDDADMEIHIQQLHKDGKGSVILETLIKREPKVEMDDDRKQPAATSQPMLGRKLSPKIEPDDERKRPADPNLAASKSNGVARGRGAAAATKNQETVATTENKQPNSERAKTKSVPNAVSKPAPPSSHHFLATKEAATRNKEIDLDSSSSEEYEGPTRASAKRALSDEDAVNIGDSDDGSDAAPEKPSVDGEVFSICDSSDEDEEQQKEGTNAEYAIRLSSGDDDDDSDDGRECMRSGRATMASRFSQLTGLSRNSNIRVSPLQRSRGGQIGRSGHAERGPLGSRKVEPKSVARHASEPSKLRKGQRKLGFSGGDEVLVPLGRKDHGSRLGLSIKQKGASKYASRQPEEIDSDDDGNSRSSKGSTFSPKKSSISRRSPAQIKEDLSKKISSGSDDDESLAGSGGTGKVFQDSDSGRSYASDVESDEESEYEETAAAELPPTSERDTSRQKDDLASSMDQANVARGAAYVDTSKELNDSSMFGNKQPIPPTQSRILGQAAAHVSAMQPQIGTSAGGYIPKKTARKSCGEHLHQNDVEGRKGEITYPSDASVQSATHSHDQVAVAPGRAKKTAQKSTGRVQQRTSVAAADEESDSSFGSYKEASKENITNHRTDVKPTEPNPMKAATQKRRGRPKKVKTPDSLEKALATYDPQVQRESRRKWLEEPPAPLPEADKFVMLEVPHLGSTTYPNGLPCRRFTLYANSDGKKSRKCIQCLLSR